jgi:glyoxylase-like metal-dependent hydrolase (beta-lactamase superfamily II)
MPAPPLETVDLLHLGERSRMSAHIFGDVIVDPGCERTIGRLVEALGDRRPRAVFLTHIHFDHAGGTGALVERYPEIEVHVHERGARHLIDPTRLVASARGIYGDRFDALWGRVVPVPAENVRALVGGEETDKWSVAYTPGHAKHHVSFLHKPTSTAFTGDVTGMRIASGPPLPPTPPPDIDIALWHESLETIARWEPDRLAYMHFGQLTDGIPQHFETMHEVLDVFAAAARDEDAAGMERVVREWVASNGGPAGQQTLAAVGPFDDLWAGLQSHG